MFLDTASISEIEKITELGFLKGVTTNPTILLKENNKRSLILESILKINPVITFVQVVGETTEALWKDYNEIINGNPESKIGIKVSINFAGIKFIKELKEQKPKQIILGTAIYSTEQGIIGALVGCDYIAPYVNRMANNNINPYEIISKTKKVITNKNLNTKIMGASFKNTNQIIDAYIAGADTVTVPVNLMNQMISKPLAEEAIKVFNEHGKMLDSLI